MALALGKLSFSDIPDVNGQPVLTAESLTNLVVPGNEGMVMPVGTTAQRPGAPIVGEFRFNTTNNEPEIWASGTWLPYARIIQTASGTMATGASTYNLAINSTAAPAVGNGFLVFTHSFTPLVAGSSVVVQYVVSAHAGTTAARNCYTATFAGNTCIGMAAGNAPGSGFTNMAVQAVYSSASTATVTITGRCGNLGSAASTMFNGSVTTNGFANALVTEYRILEII